MKIIFMGTPEFAVPILEKILEKHEVVLVVTQPDQYNYRKKILLPSPVKECALKHNLKVFQPERIRKENDIIFNEDVDLIVTAAYGQIIPEKILNYPKYRSINVHGSILPKYRGGAPIQRAIINGETETGVTIMYMEKQMDSGDIIEVKKIPILDSDNQGTVFEKLSLLGSEMILDVLDRIEEGNVKTIKQNEDEVTFAPNLAKEDELITFNKDARGVFNQIRGLNPNPSGYFIIDNLQVKVYNSVVSKEKYNQEPGIIVGIYKDRFDISCENNTAISILELQLPSKNKMSARDFINGQGKKLLVLGKRIGE